MKRLFSAWLYILLMTSLVFSCPKMYGTFEISNQKIIFLNGAEVGAAYLTIVQTAPTTDRLIGAKIKTETKEESQSLFSRFISLFSSHDNKQPMIELHDHVPTAENPEVLAMKRIKGGVEIPASSKNKSGKIVPGQPVKFEHSGKHLMLYNFPEEIRKAEKAEIILTFEKAGDIAVSFPVNPKSSAKEKPCPHHKH